MLIESTLPEACSIVSLCQKNMEMVVHNKNIILLEKMNRVIKKFKLKGEQRTTYVWWSPKVVLFE